MYYFLPPTDPCEKCTSSQEPGAVSSAASFSDIPASVLSSSTHSGERCFYNDSGTRFYRRSRYRMTCEHSTGVLGAVASTSSAAASLAKTSAPAPTAAPTSASKESTGSGADFGLKWHELLARWDRHTCSWRTRQCSLFAGLDECLDSFPRWGTMRGGECFPLPTLEHDTSVKGCSFWPTPMKTAKDANMKTETLAKCGRADYSQQNVHYIYAARYGTRASCEVWEWLMGWPLTWTALEPLETGRFQQWLRSHGAC